MKNEFKSMKNLRLPAFIHQSQSDWFFELFNFGNLFRIQNSFWHSILSFGFFKIIWKLNIYAASNTFGWICFVLDEKKQLHFNTNPYLRSRLCCTPLYTLSFRFIIIFLTFFTFLFVFLSLIFDLWISSIVYVYCSNLISIIYNNPYYIHLLKKKNPNWFQY